MMFVKVLFSGCVEEIVDEVALQMIADGRAEKVSTEKRAEPKPEVRPVVETATAEPVAERAVAIQYTRSAKSALKKMINRG